MQDRESADDRASGLDVVNLLCLGYKREDIPRHLTKSEAERMAATPPPRRKRFLPLVGIAGVAGAAFLAGAFMFSPQRGEKPSEHADQGTSDTSPPQRVARDNYKSGLTTIRNRVFES